MADFLIEKHGTIYTVAPLNDEARDWLEDNVEADDYQYLGRALCVEHSYIGALVEAIINDGYTVE